MSEDIIRYDLIVQEALLGVVRKALTIAAHEGLPGEHHFFITFKTTAPGVQLSKRMKAQYPDEMTIVLQHQFWDLTVTDSHFEVGLSFRNIPEKLSIPFKAVTGFADPSVQFALRFDLDSGERTTAAGARQDNSEGAIAPLSLAPAGASTDPSTAQDRTPAPAGGDAPVKGKGEGKGEGKSEGKSGDKEARADATGADSGAKRGKDAASAAPDGEAGKVVSIDAFRKK